MSVTDSAEDYSYLFIVEWLNLCQYDKIAPQLVKSMSKRIDVWVQIGSSIRLGLRVYVQTH